MSEFRVSRAFERRYPHITHEMRHASNNTEWEEPHTEEWERLIGDLKKAEDRVTELEWILNTPHTDGFFESTQAEAGHQIIRWGTKHDEGKTPADWFWLLGYLAGKALSKPEKRLHHIISSAAVLLNWYRYETGDDRSFRPGIKPPEEDIDADDK